ncbi:MAG: tRNA (adenosine(37)-N6)-threonylcarbamoyltransferase complex dimerization subunit type 1 TsaB [Pyrinomonadaceae bacterium]|nr:tRNA (adenosine(37)-N6)-threonylcarbamoyltransferase complex dimerization subunit type 1 TsaB [Pyrinomonadaceae bacterium]
MATNFPNVLTKHVPLVLSVETATRAGSLAILDGERVLWQQAGESGASHSSTLLLHLDEGVKSAGVQLREIDVLAVTTGPGSFTGLRTGLATVMGLAWTLEVAAVGVPTLHAIAHAEAREQSHVVALLPAGRGELFAQALELTAEKNILELGAATHITPQKLFESALARTSTIAWVGDGARLHAGEIRAAAQGQGITFVDEEQSLTSNVNIWSLAKASTNVLAVDVALLGLKAYHQKKLLRASELRANYVRPSDVELKEQCREQG